MDNTYRDIILLGIFLLLSAFFSGSETALFALKKPDLHRFSHSGQARERSIFNLMQKPEHILITVLFGNLFVNVGFSLQSTILLSQKWPRHYEYISIAVVTPVIILLCEILPKLVSINSYRSFALRAYPLLYFFHLLLYPVRFIMLGMTAFILKLFRLNLAPKRITEDQLDQAIRMSEQDGVIEKTEGDIIKNVILFSKKEASHIMYPRNRALFISSGSTIKESAGLLLQAGIVRAPVYEKDLDSIVGMVDIKDLLPYYLGHRRMKTIDRLVRDISFFPESKELFELLNDFLAKHIQIAVVVDEFGGTAGVVTLNLILSSLLGEAFSQWELYREPRVKKIDGKTIVSGDMQIPNFNYIFSEELDSFNNDTLGGYVIEKLGHIPAEGEIIWLHNHLLKVKKVRKNRILSIEVSAKE